MVKAIEIMKIVGPQAEVIQVVMMPQSLH